MHRVNIKMRFKQYPLLLSLVLGLSSMVYAEDNQITNMVEFFSFKCSHCANVNEKLTQYLMQHQIKFLDVIVDRDADALATTIMYYIAEDAGVGTSFKDTYFKAVSAGMAAYSKVTLDYVVKQLNNAAMTQLMRSKAEQKRIKLKINYANELLNQYNIRVTPSFLLNQTTLLDGEDVMDSLIEADKQ